MYSIENETGNLPILYFNYSMEVGGIETLIYEFVNRLNGKGFLPSICVLRGGGSLEKRLKSEGIQVYDIKKREGIDLSLIPRLRKILIQRGIRILHTNNYSALLYGVLAARCIKGLKHIHTEHSNVDRKRRYWTERVLSYFTDNIVCVSDDVKKSMVNNQGILPERLTVIYNGVDTERFCSDPNKKEAYREKLCIKQDAPVVGIVARLTPVKDHLTLLKAFSMLSKGIPEAVLLIVGDGQLKSVLVRQAHEMGLNNNVIFLGERQDIPELLNTMDVFVLSSLSEGHNIGLLEAMATRLPVVATNVGGNSEVIVEGATGYLVPPQNPEELGGKIKVLLQDENLRLKMGSEGTKRVMEYFDLNMMIKAYQELYLE